MLPTTYVYRWLQIADRTKKLAAGGSSLAGKATIGMTTAAAILGLAFIALGLMGRLFLMSLLAAFVHLIGIVVYFIAAGKLVRTMGPNNETGIRIVTLTRRLACCMLCSVLWGVLFTVIVGNTNLFILEFVTINFLTPLSYSAFHILIFSFVKESFARDMVKSSKRAAKRSTASVAPSTSFSVGGEGTGTFSHGATGGGGTTGGTGVHE